MLREHSQTEKAQVGPKSKLGRLVGYMVEKDGYRIWIPNERKFVFSRDVHFKPEVVCNLRNDITKTESMCPTLHVAPTEEIQVLQNYKCDDGITASTSGGINGSNSERYVQDRKSVVKRSGQIGWLVANSFAYLMVVKETTV